MQHHRLDGTTRLGYLAASVGLHYNCAHDGDADNLGYHNQRRRQERRVSAFLPFSTFRTANSIPTLTGTQVSLSGTNNISAQITYTDANNDLPVLRELFFGAQITE